MPHRTRSQSMQTRVRKAWSKPLKQSRLQKQQIKQYAQAVVSSMLALSNKENHELNDDDDDDALHIYMRRVNKNNIDKSALVNCLRYRAQSRKRHCRYHDSICREIDDTYPYILSPRVQKLLDCNSELKKEKKNETLVWSPVSEEIFDDLEISNNSREQLKQQIVESIAHRQWTHPSLKVRKISQRDSRVALRGHNAVFTDKTLPACTFLGVYSGLMMTNKEASRWFDENSKVYQYHEEYALSVNDGDLIHRVKDEDRILVWPLGGSDALHMINDARINPFHKNKKQRHKMRNWNAEFVFFRLNNKHLYAGVVTIDRIPKGSEVLLDYGDGYWNTRSKGKA